MTSVYHLGLNVVCDSVQLQSVTWSIHFISFFSWNDAHRFMLFSVQISKLKLGTCLISVTGILSLRRIKKHEITIQ